MAVGISSAIHIAGALGAGALAQEFQTLASPPPLPRGPLWERLLLEEPLGLVAGLILAAVVAFAVLNRRGRLRLGALTGAVLLVLAGGVWILAMVVQTPREAMARETEALVEAAATVNSPELERILAEDARLYSRFGRPLPPVPSAGLTKSEIIRDVRDELKRYQPLKEHSVRALQACKDSPTSGRTQVLVRITTQDVPIPFPSWWLIHWRKDSEGDWRASSIEPLAVPGYAQEH